MDPHAHVGVTKIHLRKENGYVEGVGVDDLSEEATEVLPN